MRPFLIMKIVFTDNEVDTYQDIRYVKIANLRSENDDDVTVMINEIGVLAVQYENSEWWIIPYDPIHDFIFDAIGPYETAEEVVVMMKLSSTSMFTSVW
jgi:hypothetical protein